MSSHIFKSFCFTISMVGNNVLVGLQPYYDSDCDKVVIVPAALRSRKAGSPQAQHATQGQEATCHSEHSEESTIAQRSPDG
jgi:hypothetical protein